MSSPPPTPTPTHYTISLQTLGLGYAIVIAFAFLILLSTLLLSSYLCFRRRHNFNSPPPNNNIAIIPRIIFVSESDNNDNPSVVGLDRAVINSYPKFQYQKNNVESNGSSNVCSICLCEYKEGEMLRMMPECNHYFHLCCLDVWLKLNGSCPICRNSPLPTPVSTPLAEVVPLSLYPDNRRRDVVISSS